MHYKEFYLKLEKIISDEINSSYPIDWNEDFISRNILRKFRNELNYIEIEGYKYNRAISWEAYKYDGTIENKFGDIGFIVSIDYPDGDKIEGVSFIEAKKRYNNSTLFKSIKFSQLRRINRNAPHSMVLLYDYLDITDFAQNYYSSNSGFYYGDIDPYIISPNIKNTLVTKATIAPNTNVIAVNKKDIGLYKLSLPFSYQISFRYFHGFDLDKSERALGIAKGFSSKKGFPNTICILKISSSKQMLENIPNINKKLYRRLEE